MPSLPPVSIPVTGITLLTALHSLGNFSTLKNKIESYGNDVNHGHQSNKAPGQITSGASPPCLLYQEWTVGVGPGHGEEQEGTAVLWLRESFLKPSLPQLHLDPTVACFLSLERILDGPNAITKFLSDDKQFLCSFKLPTASRVFPVWILGIRVHRCGRAEMGGELHWRGPCMAAEKAVLYATAHEQLWMGSMFRMDSLDCALEINYDMETYRIDCN